MKLVTFSVSGDRTGGRKANKAASTSAQTSHNTSVGLLNDTSSDVAQDAHLVDLSQSAAFALENQSALDSKDASLLKQIATDTHGRPFSTMLDVLQSFDSYGEAVFPLMQELAHKTLRAEFGEHAQKNFCFKEDHINLLSPLPRPTSLRDGYAFRQHVETMRKNRGAEMVPEFDMFPVFYFGNHQAVFGPGEFLVEEQHLEGLDYELECAIVIGKTGKNIKAADADKHIFGLCIMNDMSARSLQREEMKMSLGPAKGKDFGTVLGPYLVPTYALGDAVSETPNGNSYALEMTAALNGNPLSSGNLSTMNWTFAQIIERVSYGVTLYPGDVIGSGTVGTGCLAELNSSKITDNLWLKPGDKISLEIEQLGTLENTIVLNQ